jgi:hypothetical protein
MINESIYDSNGRISPMAYIDIFERSFSFRLLFLEPSYRTVPAGDQAPWVGAHNSLHSAKIVRLNISRRFVRCVDWGSATCFLFLDAKTSSPLDSHSR